ncbi:MAG: glycosyltransferase family 4 protein [bacterium]|nr:glycosyltransferase family 4 protein [bacterium]
MKLLIITQKVDMSDPVLGFFHHWIEEFSKRYEKVAVIALGVGEYHLPENVKVLSLGKEKCLVIPALSRNPDPRSHIKCGMTDGLFIRLKYIFNFYKYIWSERKNYDAVFVHMNQEYVLLGCFLWRFMAKTLFSERSPVPRSGIRGKKIWLWRNHPKGNLLTDLSIFLSNRVFCTSKYSYTAKFKKTEIMPVGIDTNLFKKRSEIKKILNSILFLGRISPVKNIDLLIESLNILNKEDFSFNAVIVGDASEKDRQYYELIKNKVREYGLDKKINFRKAVTPKETPDLYNEYELFVNLTLTGSMDKTIFEAMACETPILTSNQSLKGFIDNVFIINENDVIWLASRIKEIISLSDDKKNGLGKELRKFAVENHSLEKLMEKILK